MQPSRQFIETLVQRISNGTCTPGELQTFQEWISAMDISDPAVELSPNLLHLLKTRMHQQLVEELQALPAVTRKPIPFIKRYTTLATAAVMFLALCSGILLWYMNSRPGTTKRRSIPSLTVIDNNKNLVRRITLPDGTIIWLNRHSILTFDQQQYNRTQRCVKLSGEGFFEVAHDASKPFIVETGNIYTRVLGTTFNIEAYKQESEIRVSLVQGKVVLEDKAKAATLLLAPDQTMRYSKQTGQWQLMPMAVSDIQSWTSGALVFNEVPLEEALARIAHRFQLSIDYDKKLIQDKRITAGFAVRDWQSALHNILFVHGLDFSTRNGRVLITR
jgi:transmembrane sensor